MPLLVLEMEWVMYKKQSQELRVILGREPVSKGGPQFYNCKEMNSANNVNDLGSRFFLRLQIRAYPC